MAFSCTQRMPESEAGTSVNNGSLAPCAHAGRALAAPANKPHRRNPRLVNFIILILFARRDKQGNHNGAINHHGEETAGLSTATPDFPFRPVALMNSMWLSLRRATHVVLAASRSGKSGYASVETTKFW